ncbi:MAG TPA: hypothetical protein VFN89_03375 [Solirubrobacterales bacterium]|nr:hypothetical protein [Solirubrobacterales bacterium]
MPEHDEEGAESSKFADGIRGDTAVSAVEDDLQEGHDQEVVERGKGKKPDATDREAEEEVERQVEGKDFAHRGVEAMSRDEESQLMAQGLRCSFR